MAELYSQDPLESFSALSVHDNAFYPSAHALQESVSQVSISSAGAFNQNVQTSPDSTLNPNFNPSVLMSQPGSQIQWVPVTTPQGNWIPPFPGNASPTHDHHGQHEKLSETNLYIRGLSAETKDEDLHKMCERFGKIVSTKAIVDNENGKCKGYGFVDFEDPENARAAKESLAEDGIQIQFAKKQEEDPTNIYFSNLPEWISDKSLRDMLEPYGEVISTRILRHPGSPGTNEGRSKGVGFARMHGKEQCEKVISKFNGHPLTDPKNPTKPSGKPLLVKFADGGQKKKKNHQLNITTTFRRDEMPMAMEHFLPGFALPAGMPMHAPYLNMPVGHYQYPHNAFPAPFQLPVPADVLPQHSYSPILDAGDAEHSHSHSQAAYSNYQHFPNPMGDAMAAGEYQLSHHANQFQHAPLALE